VPGSQRRVWDQVVDAEHLANGLRKGRGGWAKHWSVLHSCRRIAENFSDGRDEDIKQLVPTVYLKPGATSAGPNTFFPVLSTGFIQEFSIDIVLSLIQTRLAQGNVDGGSPFGDVNETKCVVGQTADNSLDP
jgi:hypothetical protein